MHIKQISAEKLVDLYEHVNHTSDNRSTYNIENGLCWSIGGLKDKLSSVHTHGACVRLYDHDDCVGNFHDLKPYDTKGHKDLRDVYFNDIAHSMKLC